jgi:hypothetical protein
MLELQADFMSRVWAYHSQNMNVILEEGVLKEAIEAAFAIGNDRLQKQYFGRVVPVLLPTELLNNEYVGLKKDMIQVILIKDTRLIRVPYNRII